MRKITLMFFAMLLVGYASNAQVCGEVFMDSGGIEASYGSNESSSTTITPENSGDVVTLVFTYVDIESNSTSGGCYDYLTIYNGPDNTYPILAETLCGEVSGDGGDPGDSYRINLGDSFTSTDASGALTIEFSSDFSVQETGWEANIICGPPPTCTGPTIDSSIAVEDSCNPDGTGTYNVEIVVSDAGDAGSVFDDGTNTYPVVVGTIIAGPYTSGEEVTITLDVLDGVFCDSFVGTFEFTCPPPVPANDDCDNAIALTVNADLECAVVTSGTNYGATASSQEDDVVGTPDDDVWFSFVATSTSHEIKLNNVVAVEGTNVDMAMGLYDATGDCANLVVVEDSDPNSFSVSELTVGNTYLVRVYGYSITKTTFDICVGTPAPPPANDDCANAIVINESDASCNNSVAGTTESATNSADYSCSTLYSEVWYEFTPTTSGVYNVERTLVSATSSTYLSIYSGSCGSLTQINSSCFSSSLDETLTAGETYLISVATFNSNSIDFELCVYPAPTCFAPEAESFNAAFVVPDSVELSWGTPDDGTPESYNWEVVPVGNEQGIGTIDSGNVTSLTTTVSGLTENTLYDLYIQSDCGGGDTSAWAGPFTFNAGYCFPSGTNASTYIDIFTTTNASGVNIDNSASGFATDNYGNYFDTHTVSLAPEESFDFSLEIEGGSVGAAIWVDWNNDYNFDISEVMFTTTAYGNGPFTGTIEVPAGTADGDYRMRVLIDWNDNEPGDNDACSFGNGRGEVEDYKITVENALSTADFAISTFTYYPNPVKNTLTLNAQNTIEQVAMYNMLGQEVLRANPNAVDSDLDMSQLQTGTYFVKVTIGNVTETIRVIKQ
ncbi:GEVED domain-containing protein [Winogradskyella undariae]|uniref:GEVED domain-containing protein n=1 Tax=Winogradskyella undariae TaxID=1285465 RepID=UPI0015CDAD44|nr:GEVED domain-containing protein [Winogradskyella undariae]